MSEKVGIVLPNWIGDVVMATPTIRALRARFPGDKLLGIMRPYVADVLDGTPWLDETLLFARKGGSQLSRPQLALELRRRRVDRLVLLPNSFPSAAIAWLSGARQRVGYARYLRGPLLTDALPPPREGRTIKPISAVDYYLGLAEHLGCDVSNRRLELAVTPAESAAAAAVWQKLGLADGRPVVAISTGGAYGAAKRWPMRYSAELGRMLAADLGLNVLVLCGPAERATAAEVVREANTPQVVSLADESPSIGLSKACIARSELLVTTDSGPRHLAAALNRPTVSLFGPTDPRWAETHNSRDTQLMVPQPCAPCAQRTCPLKHHRCMTELTPDRVARAVKAMLLAPARDEAA